MATKLPSQYIHTGDIVKVAFTPLPAYVVFGGGVPSPSFTDTLPSNTDGVELGTVTIIPSSATNILRVTASAQMFNNTAENHVAWIIRDSGTTALASGVASTYAGGAANPRVVTTVVAGSTSSTTFKLRIGHSSAAPTVYVNGDSGGRKFGGSLSTFIMVEEISA